MVISDGTRGTTGEIVVKDKDNNMVTYFDHSKAQEKVNEGWTVVKNKSGKGLLPKKETKKATKKKK